jgi:hypothetical protein
MAVSILTEKVYTRIEGSNERWKEAMVEISKAGGEKPS